MSIFLNFVLRRVLGRPSGGRFRCPACEHCKYSLKPYTPNPEYKDRYSCFRCYTRGDVYDLLALVYDESFDARERRLAQLRAEYDAGPSAGEPECFLPVGKRTLEPSRDAVLAAFDALTKVEREGIAAAYEACEAGGDIPPEHRGWIGRAVAVGDRHGVLHPDDVADLVLECVSMARFIRESDARHRAECTEEDCCTIVCRAARGLPPLPIEELRRQSREDDEQQWANLIRVAKGSARQSLERQAREHPAGVRGALRDLRRGRARW